MSNYIDPLDMVYQLIINDAEAMGAIGSEKRVFKRHVPEESRESVPVVRITPISELPTNYSDNEQGAWDVILQIDVWDDKDPRGLALVINRLMKSIDLKQTTPTFEYDPDTYLVRDGRRYRGNILI